MQCNSYSGPLRYCAAYGLEYRNRLRRIPRPIPIRKGMVASTDIVVNRYSHPDVINLSDDGSGDSDLPIREPTRTEERTLGTGLDATKMRERYWLKPVLVGQFEFAEWTPDKETASHYTRSSNRNPTISDHPSFSSAVRS